MDKVLFFFSFALVAFGQPAWFPGCAILAAAFGFALFWKGMLLSKSYKKRFFLALIWFASVQGVQLSWLATADYMGFFIFPVYLFLIGAMGVQFALVSLLISPPFSWRQGAALAGCWTLFEWSRLFFLCGFSWNPAGLALAASSHSLQFASVFGVFGLSFWVFWVNFFFLKGWESGSKKQWGLALGFACFPYLFGMIHRPAVESIASSSRDLKIALIETNLAPEEKEFCLEAPHAYIDPAVQWGQIADALRGKQFDLIVLPEAALPLGAHRTGYFLASIQKYFDPVDFPPLKFPFAVFEKGHWKVSNVFLLQALANRYQAHVIAGLDDWDRMGNYNAAFHFPPKSSSYERYVKQVLVPVGEYIPFTQWETVSRFIGKQFGIHGSFNRGTEGKIFSAKAAAGISICIEETFPHLIRNLRLQGAEMFVNLTNDAWFPNTKLPQQHFDHGRIRAVENGVPMLRACNRGVSGGIDCFGEPICAVSPCRKEANALFFSFPLHSYPTLYTWWGDWAILGISFGFFSSYFLIRKKKLP